MHTLEGHRGSVVAVDFAPDGEYLVSGSSDSTARIWSVATAEVVQILKGHNNRVKDVAYAPDGKFIATASSDKSIGIWRTFGPLMSFLARKEVVVQRNHAARDAEKKRLLAPRGEFESNKAFQDRLARAEILAAQIDSLAEAKLEIDLRPLHNQIAGVIFETLEIIHTDDVTLGQYDPDREDFVIHAFDTEFLLPVPIRIAPNFKEDAGDLSIEGERQMDLDGNWKYFNLVIVDGKSGDRYRLGDMEIPIMPLADLISRRNQIVAEIEVEISERTKELYSPRGEFEPESAYKQRLELADEQAGRIETAMREKAGETLTMLENRIKAAIAQSQEPVRLQNVKLGRYDIDSQTFPLNVFGQDYTVKIDLSRAMDVKDHLDDLVVEGISQWTLDGNKEYLNLAIFDPQSNSRYPFGVQTSDSADQAPAIVASDGNSLLIASITIPADLTPRDVIGNTE